MEEKRGGDESWFKELEEREKEKQKEERWEKIRDSRYNRWYKVIKGEGVPEYLRRDWGESRWRRVARFRLGNEVKEGRYWEEKEKRLCRRCEGEIESWEHIWERCNNRGGEKKSTWQEEVGWILGEKEKGEWWMREVEKERMGEGCEWRGKKGRGRRKGERR